MSEVYQFATPLKIIYKNDKVIEDISVGEGTPTVEVSHFLINGGDVSIMLLSGGNTSTVAIVESAILAWDGVDLQNEFKTLLVTFNYMKVGEGNGVKYIPLDCPAIPTSFN